jgi:aminoglycoside phosphotransferase (APT) family kinase protein
VKRVAKFDLRAIGRAFMIHGDYVGGEPYGSGHINDTFAVVYNQAGEQIRYVHQRINHNIFKNVPALMENIERVTSHQRALLEKAGDADASRKALTLVPTREGTSFHRDAAGNFWRTYLFIEGASTHDVIKTEAQAEKAAQGFGAFQKLVASMPGARLHETIPDFHNTPARFAQLEAAIKQDAADRAKTCIPEIAFCMECKPWVARLVELNEAGELPERVTHNDTKLNNVMLDDRTQEPVCVIDLDTVMPGLALYDFGDMVRTATNSAPEDERDLSKTFVRMNIFRALVRGYLSTARDFLLPAEIDQLAFAGQLITFEIGTRFLADYLNGDVYFKVHRDGHNLDRCRTQFKLVRDMQEKMGEMREVVRSAISNTETVVLGV